MTSLASALAEDAKAFRRQRQLENMEAAVVNLRIEIVRTVDLDRREVALTLLEELRTFAAAALHEGDSSGSAAG